MRIPALVAWMLFAAGTAPAQSVSISPAYLQDPAGKSVAFTFGDLPSSVTTVQINVVPPGVTDPARFMYVYITLDPGTTTYSRTAQTLGITGPGTYVVGVATYPAGEPIGTGPLGKGTYRIFALPGDFGNVTAAVATQVGAQVVMVNNPYDFDLTANVEITYKYETGLPGPAAPNATETACACKNPYPLPAKRNSATAALAGLVGAGTYQVKLTIGPPPDAPSEIQIEPTAIVVDKVPSIPQAPPTIENNCTASASGATRTLLVSASTPTFEIDSLAISHPSATGPITGGAQTIQVGPAFSTFMSQASGGRASPIYGAFTIAIPLTVPTVGTLGPSQVKLHNTKGDSNAITCQ